MGLFLKPTSVGPCVNGSSFPVRGNLGHYLLPLGGQNIFVNAIAAARKIIQKETGFGFGLIKRVSCWDNPPKPHKPKKKTASKRKLFRLPLAPSAPL
jgi:hypothetical protein